MKILIIGDIYSIVGRQMVKYWIPKIKRNMKINLRLI